MNLHGIHTEDGRKQITCSDCGHIYLAVKSQLSSICQKCGNVEFFGNTSRESESKGALDQVSHKIVAQRVLPRLLEKSSDPLAAFRLTPDGKQVENLRLSYQVEWQLWAMVVRNFQDPAFHMAYICQAAAANQLEQAAERYREHRSVMALLSDSRWQADVADLMLERIENIAISRLPNYRGNYEFDLPNWVKLLPFDSRVTKIAWVAVGLFFVAKFLHLRP